MSLEIDSIRHRKIATVCSLARTVAAGLALALSYGCASLPPQLDGDSTVGAMNGLGESAEDVGAQAAAEARQRAEEALHAGDVDEALYMYVQAIKADSGDIESLYAIGVIHERKGNVELASHAYAEVVAAEPTHALAHQGLGLAQFEARQIDAARTSLTKAVELDSSLWRAHNALGIVADMNEEYAIAAVHYTAAMQLQPMLASIVNNRGYSRYLAGDLIGAERDFLASIGLDKNNVKAWRNLGLVYARRGEYESAMDTMVRVMPRHVAANDIGYVAMLDGNYAMAARLFEDALVASPRYYQAAAANLAELGRRHGPGPLNSER